MDYFLHQHYPEYNVRVTSKPPVRRSKSTVVDQVGRTITSWRLPPKCSCAMARANAAPVNPKLHDLVNTIQDVKEAQFMIPPSCTNKSYNLICA